MAEEYPSLGGRLKEVRILKNFFGDDLKIIVEGGGIKTELYKRGIPLKGREEMINALEKNLNQEIKVEFDWEKIKWPENVLDFIGYKIAGEKESVPSRYNEVITIKHSNGIIHYPKISKY